MYITALSTRTLSHGCTKIWFTYRRVSLGIELPNTEEVRAALGIKIGTMPFREGGMGWSCRIDVTPTALTLLGIDSANRLREMALTNAIEAAKAAKDEMNAFRDAYHASLDAFHEREEGKREAKVEAAREALDAALEQIRVRECSNL